MVARSDIENLVRQHGLHLLGIVPLSTEPDYERFVAWLNEGRHADMQYLAQNQALREDPRLLLEGAQNAIVVALPYGEPEPSHETAPKVAQYARYRDYHKVMRQKCDAILTDLKSLSGNERAEGRSLVDSAPILERALAARTQSGFIGKNTCYIHPQYGSFLLLAEILVNFALPADKPASVQADKRDANAGGCGSCKRCQVHCPTGALSTDYRIDARKCLAYWTIEHRGAIPEEFWPHLDKYWFGCDICQNVCPYNRGDALPPPMQPKLPPNISLYEVATMDQIYYERIFGGTPMTRAKLDGLKRNALIAMAVTHHQQLDSALTHAGQDASPVLRETAATIKARWL